jgi:hypothetical protein
MTAFMDNEKRKGDIPIPDNLEEMLNEAQRQALPGIVNSGWELQFLRRPLFQELVLVLHNPNDNRTGILDTDGRIKIQADIKVRDQEDQTQTTQSDKPLVWTK